MEGRAATLNGVAAVLQSQSGPLTVTTIERQAQFLGLLYGEPGYGIMGTGQYLISNSPGVLRSLAKNCVAFLYLLSVSLLKGKVEVRNCYATRLNFFTFDIDSTGQKSHCVSTGRQPSQCFVNGKLNFHRALLFSSIASTILALHITEEDLVSQEGLHPFSYHPAVVPPHPLPLLLILLVFL